jgi:cell division protein FtsW
LVVIGLFLYIFINEIAVKGSANWIQLPMGFNLQPSELSKPIIVAFLAILFEKFQKQLQNKNLDQYLLVGIIMGIGALIPVMVILQGDVGTAGIILGIVFVMFYYSPFLTKYKKFIFITVLSALVVGILINPFIITEERIERFTSFIDPCSKYETGGYQVCNVYIAINNGGIIGLGTGKSQQKYSYIPEPHTDSVFAIIAEEYGLLSTLIFILYIGVLNRIMHIASKASTMRGRYIALGVGVYIFFHILINMGGLFGLIPLTGVPLPFLSYGGSFTLSLIAALAMVQRVNIETVNTKIKI